MSSSFAESRLGQSATAHRAQAGREGRPPETRRGSPDRSSLGRSRNRGASSPQQLHHRVPSRALRGPTSAGTRSGKAGASQKRNVSGAPSLALLLPDSAGSGPVLAPQERFCLMVLAVLSFSPPSRRVLTAQHSWP